MNPMDFMRTLDALRRTPWPWDGPHPLGWSAEGRERWASVIDLPLPTLPCVDARVVRPTGTWRVWMAPDTPSALFQLRQRRGALVSWRALPLDLDAWHQPQAWAQAHRWALMQQQRQWQAMPPEEQRRAFGCAALAAVLRGPAWAWLSGRANLDTLWRPEDAQGMDTLAAS